MGDLRGGAACRQDSPSQQFPRTHLFHPSTWPLRLTCLAALQEMPPAPGSTALLAPKERLCPSKCPETHSDWTNPGHVSTPEPIPAAKGRVCVDWLAWVTRSVLQSQDIESAFLGPHRAPLGVWGLPRREGGRDAGRYQHVASEGHSYQPGRVIMGITDNTYEAPNTQQVLLQRQFFLLLHIKDLHEKKE